MTTTFTQTERHEAVQALLYVKGELSREFGDGKPANICHILPGSPGAYKRVLAVIRERLGTSETLADWLVARGFQARGFHDPHWTYRMLQDARHRWLDSLIAEFSE